MPAKAIPPARDRLQSRLLVWVCMAAISIPVAVRSVGFLVAVPRFHNLVIESVGVSSCFALLSWRLKAATAPAAASGGAICLCILYGTTQFQAPLTHSAFTPLVALFVLTFFATRAGRERKVLIDMAESRTGRTASQVVSNLGLAALLAFPLSIYAFLVWGSNDHRIGLIVNSVCVLAALAEATADTVSSEIGQAFGGTPFMLTTLRRVPPGTDGAISLKGTLAGIAAAALIAATGAPALGMSATACFVAFAAAVAGLFFDSFLGATLERRGYLGNDLVNFTSTAFAATIALLAVRFCGTHLFR